MLHKKEADNDKNNYPVYSTWMTDLSNLLFKYCCAGCFDAYNYCMENEIKVWTIKDNYRLGDDLTSKVLAFAFGLSA